MFIRVIPEHTAVHCIYKFYKSDSDKFEWIDVQYSSCDRLTITDETRIIWKHKGYENRQNENAIPDITSQRMSGLQQTDIIERYSTLLHIFAAKQDQMHMIMHADLRVNASSGYSQF